jgi:hypothetical protein
MAEPREIKPPKIDVVESENRILDRRKLSVRGRVSRRHQGGLFPSEDEIARRLSQNLSGWRARAIILEREGLPRICPVMGGRYWPAVLAYFNRRYGIGNLSPSAVDGMENLDAL